MTLNHHPRQRAGLAVFLIVFAASVGIAARLFVPGLIGQSLFLFTRVWIIALPLIWVIWIDQSKPALSLPLARECRAGVLLGIFMFGVILGSYWLVGQQWIDRADVQLKAQQIGIASPTIYLLGAFYFTFINALIEEYIWRWFVYRKCEVLLPQTRAVCFAALCFTLHHIIALAAYISNGWIVTLGSLGVFTAGAVWSWCYLTYRSLWAGYISHVLADLAIALIGWHLLFA